MKIGYIGLGVLGKTIAKRLISENIELVLWNRTKAKTKDLKTEIVNAPKSLAGKTDIIFLNLFDSAAVRAVLFGKEGLADADLTDKIIVDTTTNHFNDVLFFHKEIEKRGGYYLETPVLGSVIPASQGNLVVLVSGNKKAFEKVKPCLEKIAKTIFYLKKPALATKMKLINNLVLGNFMASIAEAVVFGETAGVEKETVLNILSTGAGNSMVMNAKKDKILRNDFSTHFSSALIYKDLHYLQDLAKILQRPLLTGAITKEIFGMTFKDKNENLDFSFVYDVLKKM